MDSIILSSTSDVLPFIDRVAAISDQHREEFGFLPSSVYEERALRGQLWVVTNCDRDRILGYLVFGGSQAVVTIVQLYVHPQIRRAGIGSALVKKLKEYARANHNQVIKARVASDLAGNHFWESQGFYIIQQVPGGRSRRRTINVRVHELPMSSLWDTSEGDTGEWLHGPVVTPLLPTPTYVLDLNILFDVIHGRPEAELARKVFSAALHGDFRLCVSQELAEELERSSQDVLADPVLQFARELPTLPPVPWSSLDPMIEDIRRIVFPDRMLSRRDAENDRSDLCHLAACLHHAVTGFVTRERALLRAAPVLAEKMGLRVLSPLDLVNPVDALDPADFSAAVQVGPTSIRVVPFTPSHRGTVEELAHDIGVSASILDTVLEAGTSARPRTRLVILAEERLIACASWTMAHAGSAAMRAYILADETNAGAQPAVDHLLGALLRSLPERRLINCELMTARSQVATRSTARLLGFSRVVSHVGPLVGLAKHAYRGVVGPAEWGHFVAQVRSATETELPAACPSFRDATSTGFLLSKRSENIKRAIELMTFETELSPLIVAVSGRNGVLVPIRDKLASELLPEVTVQNPLFSKEAMTHLERAYFGKSINLRLFPRGVLVVFYISKADGGRGEAVGLARVTSSGAGSPANLKLSLLRQGVLSVVDLGKFAARTGEVSYFTFDSFLKFERPVSFSELSSLGCVGDVNLVTSQALEFDKLVSLIERSHGTGGRDE
jgi:GNAT superfamily N-acetyltransferase/predicted nucleic acid-binding protein